MNTNITRYAYFWTSQRDKYRLFTINYCGNIELLIYHIPSKRVVTLPNVHLERAIIARMVERGVPIVDDELLAHQQSNYGFA